MKNYSKNSIRKTKMLLLNILIMVPFLLIQSARADFNYIFFSINGDTTLSSMTQGDEFGWGSNCELGASIEWEIYYDLNNNSVIDKTTDILLNSELMTDGNLIYEETSIPDGWLFSGTFFVTLEPGNYIFRATDLGTDSSIQKICSVSAMPSPPNQLTGTVHLPGISPPDPRLANIGITAESETGAEGFFVTLTDNTGFYSMNVGNIGTGVTFYLDATNVENYVNPDYISAVASGVVPGNDFTYDNPVDSVWGYVRDGNGALLPFETTIRASSGITDKDADTKNSRYVIYFTEAQKGDWWLEHDSRNSPVFITQNGLSFSHDTISSFQHDITLTRTDAAIYAVITENGSAPLNHYRVDAYTDALNSYAEGISDTGSNNIAEIAVSSLDNSGWFVSLATYDWEYQIPDGYIVTPQFYSNISPGDTVTFNLYESCCVGIRGNIDNGPDDGTVSSIDIADLVYMAVYMFGGGPEPVCYDEANVTGSTDGLDIAELVYMAVFMFSSGPEPLPCPTLYLNSVEGRVPGTSRGIELDHNIRNKNLLKQKRIK